MAGAPRAAIRFGLRGFISITRTIARGVTAMVVGSGALLAQRTRKNAAEMKSETSRWKANDLFSFAAAVLNRI